MSRACLQRKKVSMNDSLEEVQGIMIRDRSQIQDDIILANGGYVAGFVDVRI